MWEEDKGGEKLISFFALTLEFYGVILDCRIKHRLVDVS